jgi:hypothetical protein
VSSIPQRPKASLGVVKTNIPRLLARSKVIYNALLLAAATLFVSPPVTLVTLLALIEALDEAEQAAAVKTFGLKAVRNGRRDLLWIALRSLREFVQGLADNLTTEDAIALIEAAGMVVLPAAMHDKPILQAKLGLLGSGIVHLVANAGLLTGRTSKKRTFNWQWSENGTTWNDARSTPVSETDIANLTLGTTYWFRVSVTLGKAAVTGEWSQPVGLLVV